MKDRVDRVGNERGWRKDSLPEDGNKERVQKSILKIGSSSFSFRAKIYLGMGGVCVLLAFVAGIMLLTINKTLSQSQELSSSISRVADNVKKVSGSISDSLVKQEQQYEVFLNTQRDTYTQRLSSQKDLYENIISIERALSDVQMGADLIIIEGKKFADIAEKVEKLRQELGKFFKSIADQDLDEKLVKNANRARRAYLFLIKV